ncbi:unnamed protein product [Medioppia subpectinata]|uniref:Uncharacterized protein n=1 Tax=Medioppia subpectinata TaxID=1979941 RepID=A0A7R9LRF5_9ACAR|nr:unnamed protein product [Medioppia subpectinata]CAG2121080.1 unnamed protein product [Medioppia subpectinata]
MIWEPIARYGPLTRLKLYLHIDCKQKPLSSDVLSAYLKTQRPFWSSYFVRYKSVVNDQFGCSHFNWSVGDDNYHVLRIGCYPFIKYHCTRRTLQDLTLEDRLYTCVPSLMYGLSALFLAKVTQTVNTNKGEVVIYFYEKEVPNARF